MSSLHAGIPDEILDDLLVELLLLLPRPDVDEDLDEDGLLAALDAEEYGGVEHVPRRVLATQGSCPLRNVPLRERECLREHAARLRQCESAERRALAGTHALSMVRSAMDTTPASRARAGEHAPRPRTLRRRAQRAVRLHPDLRQHPAAGAKAEALPADRRESRPESRRAGRTSTNRTGREHDAGTVRIGRSHSWLRSLSSAQGRLAASWPGSGLPRDTPSRSELVIRTSRRSRSWLNGSAYGQP